MTDPSQAESESAPGSTERAAPYRRATRAATVIACVLAAGAAATAGVRAGKAYIDHAAAQAVAEALSELKPYIDGRLAETAGSRADEQRMRAVVLDTIRKSPKLVAETLNEYIQQQQRAIAGKQDAGYRVLVPEMAEAKGLPTAGAADAKVTLVYFFDANCPYCKAMDPALKPYKDPAGGVRIVYREIPILGPPSERAARYAAALWIMAPEKYAAFHEGLMKARGHIDESAVERIASETLGDGLARRVGLVAVTDPDGTIKATLDRNLDLARRAGINGTPFIAVADKAFFNGAVPAETLAAAVAKALAGEP